MFSQLTILNNKNRVTYPQLQEHLKCPELDTELFWFWHFITKLFKHTKRLKAVPSEDPTDHHLAPFFHLLCIHLGRCWLPVAAWGPARCGEQGQVPSVRVKASQRGGSSCCGSCPPGLGHSSGGSWALLSPGLWHLPRPGIKPMFPALAGRFFSTGPPGMSSHLDFTINISRFASSPSSPSITPLKES